MKEANITENGSNWQRKTICSLDVCLHSSSFPSLSNAMVSGPCEKNMFTQMPMCTEEDRSLIWWQTCQVEAKYGWAQEEEVIALIPGQMPEEVPSAETHFLTAHFQLGTHKEKYYTTVYSTLDIKQTKAERSTCFSLGVHSCLGSGAPKTGQSDGIFQSNPIDVFRGCHSMLSQLCGVSH